MQRELSTLLTLLEGSSLSPSAAGRLVLELVECAGAERLSTASLMKRCRNLIHLGSRVRQQERLSVSFARAAAEALADRQDRRPRTRAEFRSICQRLLRANPALAQRRVRQMTPEDCRLLLEHSFSTARQRAKGRLILHGIFAHSLRRQWCSSNPVAALRAPSLQEAEIHPLNIRELQALLRTALQPIHRACMPALGLMLWAGLRPAEVERLCWEDIDVQEGVISLRPRHSKTGGARHVTLHPVLATWLRESGAARQGRICPPNWPRRWKSLRNAAGIIPWRQDVLRHSFASYHLKHWHDLARLQLEMGHHSPTLLRTRYLSMRGITAAAAARFWTPQALWRKQTERDIDNRPSSC